MSKHLVDLENPKIEHLYCHKCRDKRVHINNICSSCQSKKNWEESIERDMTLEERLYHLGERVYGK